MDGVIGEREFVNFFTSFRLPAPEGKAAFAKLDTNGDGKLTHAEVLQAVREFHLSSDPEAPGNWLFGEF